MIRIATLAAIAAFAAAPASAETYSAKPIAAPSATKIVGKDISWTWANNAFVGSTDTSRPLILCQDLAKRAGRLSSFVADGRTLSAVELDKCNAKAGAPTALAQTN